ncbi:MAG TPA: vitamin K epoxide reductase family protein [Chthonomonadaceae bacterium]|nr:vitamin K epoxide reductase family protein [Chthonomonadaceae bacterium]
MTVRSITNYITMALALAGCVVAIVLTYEEYHPQADIGCSKLGGNCSKTIQSDYGHVGPVPTSVFGLAMYLAVGTLCFLRARAIRAGQAAWDDRAFRESGHDAEPALTPEQRAAAAELGQPAEWSVSSDADEGEAKAARAAKSVREGDAIQDGQPGAAPIGGYFGPAVDERAPDFAEPANPARRRLDLALFCIAAPAVAISWWLQYIALWQICSFCPWCFGSATLATLIFLLAAYDLFISGHRLEGEQRLLAGVAAFIVVCFGFVGTPIVIERTQVCGVKGPPGQEPPDRSRDHRALILGEKPAHHLDYRGDPKAKYTIVEFGDYQCTHCRKAIPILEALMKNPPDGGLRVAFRNYPFTFHTWAMQCALAAEAAGRQGKFWPMHDRIYAEQEVLDKPSFSRAKLDEWAASLGLNVKKFDSDYESTAVMDRVKEDQDAANDTRLSITPSFYLVTPTKMTRLDGTDIFENVVRDRKNAAWQ